jgi:hypothetical protein
VAKDKHIKIIKRGIKRWNEWRAENPDIRPNFSDGFLRLINFKGANLKGADFTYADVVGADLSFADLRDADLSYAYLGSANFSSVNLSQADLTGADFVFTNFFKANLSYTDLSGADISFANLTDADLTRSKFGFTTLTNNDLSVVKGLDAIEHIGPSYIGIETIYKSNGNIPHVFLRGAGVPENFIEYMASLTGQALQFYSCFISFTESDNHFSERLYNDLQAEGVRCWRWKEDAKWGKTLIRSIDEAVITYDKLVVVCSEQSLNSPAVLREIERALQKEDEFARQGRESEVLFPIRLDDFVFTEWKHHRKPDLIAKNIGDFRRWKEPELYRRALEKLILDLRAG